MKRFTLVTVLLACGFAVTSAPLFAQTTPAATAPSEAESAQTGSAPPTPAVPNWFSGKTNLLLFGHENAASSKFQEYRDVPKGAWMPVFTIQANQNGNDFALFAENVAKRDQRYSGFAKTRWVGVTFDYNQVPHNMGNDGRTLLSQTAPTAWSMSGMLRGNISNAVDSVPTTARTYPFYSTVLGSTIASAGFVDLTGLRQRGDVALDFGPALPFDLAVTYSRELKSGARGASGGDILGAVTSAVDVPEPVNELTQDFGARWAYNSPRGNVYATFNRNVYNDRLNSLVIDNPFRASDAAYISTSVPGGPAQVQFSTSPDNQANRGSFGGLLKFKRQTRITADIAFGTWTQNAQFLPFTINSAIITPSGIPATSLAALPQQSLNGKINTTSLNFGFSSRPVDDLSIRLRYRGYDLTNKTTPISWLGGSTAGSPDRSWGTETATPDAPYGFATANIYDNSSKRFDAQIGYDIKDVTLEAAFRTAALERTFREATSGNDNGYALSGVYKTKDWLGFRFTYDWLHRTAKGWDPATSLGLQSDEAERKTTRGGVDVELTPWSQFGVTLAYFRRNDDYPNRPYRVKSNPDTTVGLLGAKYDTYTLGFDYNPTGKAELNAFYTYEKNAQTNRWVTLTSGALNNQLRYDGSDRGDTYGVNGVFHLVPDKWTFSLFLQHQKVNGFMDITAREAGTFYTPGRTTLVPPGTGGALDINDFDDTNWTSGVADLAYGFARAWSLSVGYAYDKYTHADAFAPTTSFPQSVLFYLNANDGNYTVNSAYTRLTYRF